jgi:hypothetical protein
LATLIWFNLGTLLAVAALWMACSAAGKIRFAPRAGWAAVALAGVGGFLVLTRL